MSRPRMLQPVRFVPVEQVFKPQIKVRATRDLSGPTPKAGVKFSIGMGRIGYVDADSARVWQAKGFVEILEGEVKPVSPDELAELTSKDASISLGESNG